MQGDPLALPDPAIGLRPPPDAATLREHPRSGLAYHVFTDRRRARVNAPGEQTPERVELLTLGGSCAWGHGLENEATFTQRLGERLGAPAANLAFAGFGTVQALQLLEENADLGPRVVVYAFLEDHLRRPVPDALLRRLRRDGKPAARASVDGLPGNPPGAGAGSGDR